MRGEKRNNHGLTIKEIVRIHRIIDEVCQRHSITRGEINNQDEEAKLLIMEEIHWEMIQDILHYS